MLKFLKHILIYFLSILIICCAQPGFENEDEINTQVDSIESNETTKGAPPAEAITDVILDCDNSGYINYIDGNFADIYSFSTGYYYVTYSISGNLDIIDFDLYVQWDYYAPATILVSPYDYNRIHLGVHVYAYEPNFIKNIDI